MLTERYDRALMYASAVHGGHTRKGTKIPYLSHLMAVSALVMEAGGSEDMAIAALLHDAAEDRGGQERLDDIYAKFGATVADIVEQCSDSLVADQSQKRGWSERKCEYLENLARSSDADYLLVTAADKLHNAQAMLRDLRNYKARGKADEFWQRFEGKGDHTPAQTLGYYKILAEELGIKLADAKPERLAISVELSESVAALIEVSDLKADCDWYPPHR